MIRVVILRCDSSDQLTEMFALSPPAKWSMLCTSSSVSREKIGFSTVPPTLATSPKYQLSRLRG